MTDQEVDQGYAMIASSSGMAKQLEADHLACRKALSALLGNTPRELRARLNGLDDMAHGRITCTAADIRDAMRALGIECT